MSGMLVFCVIDKGTHTFWKTDGQIAMLALIAYSVFSTEWKTTPPSFPDTGRQNLSSGEIFESAQVGTRAGSF